MLSVGEFFCGAGGMALGAKQAGFGHQFATDYNEDACDTFSVNVFHNVLCDDIKNVDLERFPYVDLFAYGFPCNDFSMAGKTKGLAGEFGNLYSYGVEYLNLRSPKVFVAENVSGIAGANAGAAFKQILTELKDSGRFGYTLTVHKYKFEEYGVPQKRHRYVVVGFRNDLNLNFKIPKPSGRIVTAGEALADIPDWATNNEKPQHPPQVAQRLSHIKAGQNVWQAQEAQQMPDHLKLNWKPQMSNSYRKTHPDQPAYTLLANSGGGGHGYHWEDRALTNRERARLQTFPDSFQFVGGKVSVRSQIGMAVPVLASKIIFESIKRQILDV
jgi:DNA (cytosine-5)-methyltransferase 1